MAVRKLTKIGNSRGVTLPSRDLEQMLEDDEDALFQIHQKDKDSFEIKKL